MKTTPITLRMADQQDADSVCRLIGILEDTAFDLQDFQPIYQCLLQNPNHQILLAEVADPLWEDEKRSKAEAAASSDSQNCLVVGMLHMRMEEQLHHCGRAAEILELVIVSEFRNQKIGERLFNEACKIAEENGCLLIECSSNVRRKRAHRFYESHGMHKNHFGFDKPLPASAGLLRTIGIKCKNSPKH